MRTSVSRPKAVSVTVSALLASFANVRTADAGTWSLLSGNYVDLADSTGRTQHTVNWISAHEHHTQSVSVVSANGIPYVATEVSPTHDPDSTSIAIRYYRSDGSGTAWGNFAGGVVTYLDMDDDTAGDARSPDLAADANNLYAAWQELNADGTYDIYLKYKPLTASTSTEFQLLPGNCYLSPSLGGTSDAIDPSIVAYNGTLYVSYTSVDSSNSQHIKVWRCDVGGGASASWTSLTGNVDAGPNVNLEAQLALTSDGTKLAVALTYQSALGSSYKIAVKELSGTTWVQKGPALNRDAAKSARNADLRYSGSSLYAAWEEAGSSYQGVYVARWNSASLTPSWNALGSAWNLFDANAQNAKLAFDNQDPNVVYVAFTNDYYYNSVFYNSRALVRYCSVSFSGSSYRCSSGPSLKGTVLNYDNSPSYTYSGGYGASAYRGDIYVNGSSLFVAWTEDAPVNHKTPYADADANGNLDETTSVFSRSWVP